MTNHIIENEQSGLCSICIYFANCTTRQSFKGKILQCEEFDDYMPQQIVKEEKKGGGESPVQYAPLKGLCMNCDYADSCTIPKPESGIWYCNEYQ